MKLIKKINIFLHSVEYARHLSYRKKICGFHRLSNITLLDVKYVES